MKILINIILLILVSILTTGCLSANYNRDYISKELKPELKKVNKNICINESSNFTEETHSIDFSLHETNAEVAKNYFEQYFTDVNNQDKDCFLRINTQVSNIVSTIDTLDGMDVRFDFKLSAYKKGELLFETDTEEYYSSNVYITFFMIGSAPYKTANEAFHKGLLDIYEHKVEKELLKSLKINN